jgi:sulfate transport system permease protein
MRRRVLPGFVPNVSFALSYLAVLVVLPLGACVLKASSLSWSAFSRAVWNDRAIAAYGLTFGASFVAAIVSVGLGLLVAWVLVRYQFPFRRVFDSLVDLPFALPTAVAGLVYSSLYVENGWLGRFLVPLGIEGAYSRLGIVLVLTFVAFPFIVRTVQPILESLEGEMEEAAMVLGASKAQTFWRVILPSLFPALVTGFALAFARALGEYGSVVFISGNMPGKTEIAPVLIVARLEEFAYAEATAIAVVLLAGSFSVLILINLLDRWCKRYYA